MPVLPNALRFKEFPTKEDAATALFALVDRVPNVDLDGMSNYRAAFAKTSPLKVSNWASGGAVGALKTSDNVWRLKDGEVATFFVKLFEEVRTGAKAEFARADLFHGHINLHKKTLLIVFHAAEYPVDLDDTQFPAANAALVEPKKISIKDPGFRYRNAIYSFASGTLQTFDTLNLDPTWKANFDDKLITLRDDTLGEPVAGLNYFPKDGIPFPFLR